MLREGKLLEQITKHFDVAIVGCGPTGATLANLLAECGVRVAVLEREAAIYHLPRAVHFDGETMRVFQAAGIAEQLSEKVRVNPGMRFVDQQRNLLMDWPRPQEIGPQGWYSSYRLHQPDLEKLLRDKLTSRDTAMILTETEVISVEDQVEEVTLHCRNPGDGHRTMVKANFVVGCDGAGSLLREAIGSGMDDLGFDERWLVVDLLLKRDRPDLGDHTVQFSDPDRPMTYCRSPENRRRWEIAVLEDETDNEVLQTERIWDFLAPWIGPEDASLERSAVYTFRSAIAQNWRKGRLMIAGDAAHLTPPFMGQGMCAGIRDAANLAWKLALCVNSNARIDLLDSYQAERAPHVHTFIETAVRLGGLINAMDRDAALSLTEVDGDGKASMDFTPPPLGPSDLVGFVVGNTLHTGRLFSQPTLSNGQRLDDAVGYAPVLVVRHKLPGGVAPSMRVLDGEAHPALADALDDIGANAVLLRPDRYIASSAMTQADIKAIAALTLPTPFKTITEREPIK